MSRLIEPTDEPPIKDRAWITITILAVAISLTAFLVARAPAATPEAKPSASCPPCPQGTHRAGCMAVASCLCEGP